MNVKNLISKNIENEKEKTQLIKQIFEKTQLMKKIFEKTL